MTGYIAAGRLRRRARRAPIDYDTIFAVGALLFVVTLVMNMISIRLVRRYRQVY